MANKKTNQTITIENNQTNPVETKQRIGIVGGGIAGLYTAWRILKHGDPSIKFEVEIFEADEKFGGRIKSQEIPGIHFKAELGAMRFYSNHLLLKSLLDEFRIEICKFNVSSPKLRVRGRSLSMNEITDGKCFHCGASIPYLLKAEERGKTPVQLILDVIDELLKDLTFPILSQAESSRVKKKIAEGEIDTETWDTIKQNGQYHCTPLHSIGFWNLLQHSLSNEAVQFIHDSLSLESVLGNWSIAEAIPWFRKDSNLASQDLFMVTKGMYELIEKLESQIKYFKEEEIQKRKKAKLQNGNEDESKNGNEDEPKNRIEMHTGTFVTRCEQIEDKKWKVTYQKGDSQREAEFDNLILALPQFALQKLEIFKDETTPWKIPWLDWVHPHRLFKLFLLYENAWWIGDEAQDHAAGRIFTDLPLRQIYYFPSGWIASHCNSPSSCDQPKEQENEEFPIWTRPMHKDTWSDSGNDKWALLIASYSDEQYVSFWLPPLSEELGIKKTGLNLQYETPTNVSHLKALEIQKVFEEAIPESLRANKRMVKKVQQQLKEIHGHEIPDPIIGVIKDWGEAPFGAGWHTWKVGAKPWNGEKYQKGKSDEEKSNEEKLMLENLHLCGEAYSNEQGWIEGALKSSEIVLLEQLHIKQPCWETAREIKIKDLEDYLYT